MGAKKLVESPEIMWEWFEKYVIHTKNNPVIKREVAGNPPKIIEVELEKPITFEGFECFMADNNVIQNLGDYSANTHDAYTDYVPVMKRIKNNCWCHNFDRATVGVFNARIIASKLGLIEKSEQTNNVTITQITGMKVE